MAQPNQYGLPGQVGADEDSTALLQLLNAQQRQRHDLANVPEGTMDTPIAQHSEQDDMMLSMLLQEQNKKRLFMARQQSEALSGVSWKETKIAEWRACMKLILDLFDDDSEEDDDVQDEIDEKTEENKTGDDARSKTRELVHVCEALKKSWQRDPIAVLDATEYKVNITNKIADACRQAKWRLPIGNSGILQFYLDTIPFDIISYPSSSNDFVIPFMRLLGNSCADTNENRARVVKADILHWLIRSLRHLDWRPYIMAVLFNVCVEYEPAQKQAVEKGLVLELLRFLSDYEAAADAPALGSVPKLLELLIHDDLPEDKVPSSAPVRLLDFAMSFNVTIEEDFLALTTVAIQFLSKERFQRFAISEHGILSICKVLKQLKTRGKGLDNDDAQAVTQARKELTDILSDISDVPNFVTLVLEEDSGVASTLCSWLSSSDPQLQVCACLMLGNVARSDKTCIVFVHKWKIHEQLMEILKTAIDSQLLYAALGFLKNLALPLPNKSTLGEAGLLELLPRLWKMDVAQQIQFSGVSLARQLIINTSSNVSRLLQVSISPVPPSADYSVTPENNIDVLTTLFLKSDIEPTKTETSRLLLTICRILSTPSSNSSTAATTSLHGLPSLEQFFFGQNELLRKPLSFLITQQKWPALRSEAFFVFALTSRTPLGSSLVTSIILSSEVFTILQQTLSPSTSAQASITQPPATAEVGKDVLEKSNDLLGELMAAQDEGTNLEAEEGRGKNKEEMMKVDKMNVLVLLTEVLKNAGEDVAVEERAKLEGLIAEGSKNL